MQGDSSRSITTSKSDLQSATIIIHLVNPDQARSGHFKQERKPHITLTNFENLIKPTPFQKFQTGESSPSQIVFRSNSSPVNGTNNLDSTSADLIFRKIRSSQSSPIRKKKTRTLGRLGTLAPKSRFAFESQRNLDDFSP